LIEGEVLNQSFLTKIFEAIEPWFENLPISKQQGIADPLLNQ
jgi:hypothetical protein